jgi:hypothetical protein
MTRILFTLGLVALAVAIANAQPPALEAVRPDSIVVSLYREGTGEPRIKVGYQILYSDGTTEVSRPMRRIYSEPEALAAGYTQDQIDTILVALELVEASIYAVNALPTPTPAPAPTPAPTPNEVP